eukprot:2404295-Pyramimonas_sp.AAC.1
MSRYPCLHVNLDALPPNYARTEILKIPIMIKFRGRPRDLTAERREFYGMLKGDGAAVKKTAGIRPSSDPSGPEFYRLEPAAAI